MNLDGALTLLASDPAAPLDLAELALLLAGDEYPDLDAEAHLGELAAMAHEARRYLRGPLEAQVSGLCRYLFHDMGFRGNVQDYYDPRNSYLNDVLDRRTGIPITLSAVAIAVGTRAGLDVAGVGLPGHFIARARAGGREVLFDPFHGGRRLDPEQCERLVEQTTGQPFRMTPEHLRPVCLGDTVLRMLTNLKVIYLRGGDTARAIRVLERLRQLRPDDLLQRRDLGIALLQDDRAGLAIDHLAAYLAEAAGAPDAETIKQLLSQARTAVARWN
jgi:regulator of sirC expression with transglutaminase-like and TPR domain